MNKMCKTDSDEVLFISETIAPSVQMTVVIDQAKRLALQRDIDLESLPKQLSKLSTALVQRPEKKMKMKIENLTDENIEKKIKKCKKEPTSPTKINDPTVADRTAQRVEKKKKKVKKEDSVVEVQGSFEVGEEEKEKKKIVNDCDIIDGNGKETKLTDCQEGTKKSHEKKSKNKTQIKEEIVTPVDENIAKEAKKEKKAVQDKKAAKKAKKEKNEVDDKKATKKAKKEQNEVHDKKVAKKPKKEKNEVHDTNGYHVTDDSPVIKKKMKKKREKEKSESNKKKRKDNETQTKHETVWQQEEADNVPKTTKKQQNKTPHTIAEDNIKHKKKRKKITAEQDETTAKKKKKTAEPKLAESEVATETPEEVCELKPKRKKKKTASPDNDKSEDSNKEAAQEEKSDAGVEEGETQRKKKGEKAKKRKSSGLDTQDETASIKKKKRKVEEPKREETVDQEPSKKRKKKSSVEVENHLEEVYPDSSMKEKKKKGEKKEKKKEEKKKKKGMKEELGNHVGVPHGDVVFLSEKSGNTDELTINQGFGQWSTAQFESSQQQQKFLRLMGGFKKDSQPAAAGSPATANMALGKNAQERLQQGLVEEFERAHSRRIDFNSRGAGLGFSESTKKKVFIDINLRRSVRFDD
ncbi:lysine-rich nucleolar protein 1 isoform X2 [Hippocampus comes]|nr:PREDICTED: lysine-rich nucleolar protein 1 isoform X2 [Hippocampus comes]